MCHVQVVTDICIIFGVVEESCSPVVYGIVDSSGDFCIGLALEISQRQWNTFIVYDYSLLGVVMLVLLMLVLVVVAVI